MIPRLDSVTVRSANLVVRRFELLVATNFHDRNLNLARLAAEMGMSERQLQRELRRHAGVTPSEFVRTYRLARSLEHLLAGATVHDTALAVGFGSQAYFASCFKAEYGRTPSEYRDRRKSLI